MLYQKEASRKNIEINIKFSLMTWINSLLEDENIFPSKIGVPFPPIFRDTAYKIIKRLFRIYAHIYIRHLQVRRDTKFMIKNIFQKLYSKTLKFFFSI